MIRVISIGVLGVTVALLVLHLVLTSQSPSSLSPIRTGYTFTHDADEPATTEVSGYVLKRAAMTRAVLQTASLATDCVISEQGTALMRFCTDETDDEPFDPGPSPLIRAAWVERLSQHAAGLTPTQLAAADIEQDLSIR